MSDYGVSGYLTPDTLPIERHCRTFRIPNSTQWLSVFMGALLPLIYPENWKFYGELSPDEAADAALDVIWDAYAQDEGLCPALIPAPYWDSAADVGMELPADEQIWYGKAGSFAEDLQLWILQGAIVLTFGLAGIKPAIRFATVYRTFVVQFKNDHVGATIRFFIDSFQIFTAIDSGDGTISDVRIVGAADVDTHELQIQADEGDGLTIVRKQLSPNELSNENLRLNPDTGIVQHTTDGGVTWRDDPNNDPRTGLGQQFPPRGGSDPRCDAAANMTAHMQALVNEFCTALSQLQLLNAWAAVLFIFMPEIWILLAPLEVVLAALLALGADYLCTFSSDEWNIVEKIIYCNIADDGTCSAAQLTTILTAIHAQVSAPLYDFCYWIFQIIGNVGMTNAGATGDVVGDCSGFACAWCVEWDFTVSDGGFTAFVNDGFARALYVPGVGWGGNPAHPDFPNLKQINSPVLTSATYEQFEVFISSPAGAGQYVQMRMPDVSGSTYNSGLVVIVEGNTSRARDFDTFATSTSFWVSLDGSPSGQYLTKFRVRGHGTPPLEPNCS